MRELCLKHINEKLAQITTKVLHEICNRFHDKCTNGIHYACYLGILHCSLCALLSLLDLGPGSGTSFRCAPPPPQNAKTNNFRDVKDNAKK